MPDWRQPSILMLKTNFIFRTYGQHWVRYQKQNDITYLKFIIVIHLFNKGVYKSFQPRMCFCWSFPIFDRLIYNMNYTNYNFKINTKVSLFWDQNQDMSSSCFGGKALELISWLGSKKILILVYIFNQIIPNIFDRQTRTYTEPDFSEVWPMNWTVEMNEYWKVKEALQQYIYLVQTCDDH